MFPDIMLLLLLMMFNAQFKKKKKRFPFLFVSKPACPLPVD